MAKTLPPPQGTIHRTIRLLADSLAQLGATGETASSIDLRFRDQVVLRTQVK